jgi:hypothetical protein
MNHHYLLRFTGYPTTPVDLDHFRPLVYGVTGRELGTSPVIVEFNEFAL